MNSWTLRNSSKPLKNGTVKGVILKNYVCKIDFENGASNQLKKVIKLKMKAPLIIGAFLLCITGYSFIFGEICNKSNSCIVIIFNHTEKSEFNTLVLLRSVKWILSHFFNMYLM
ncbi:hypothetical protein B1B04_05515 [Lysinibacillus sp. KCTC 33748]|nr:hypothetical protein B1B04_05515 [Lysinibacillus sp. KCTC 33748]SKB45848.1 hypothetical protein SAMN06295926_102588 [Lysinibacillus sp. AC-3]